MCCLHHVGWIREAFTHSSLPNQFFLGNVRLSLNQYNLFPIPRLGHARIMPGWSVNSSPLWRETSLCAGWSQPESWQTPEGRWGSLLGQLRASPEQEVCNLAGITKWIGRSPCETCGWLRLCLPGLLAGGFCVGWCACCLPYLPWS